MKGSERGVGGRFWFQQIAYVCLKATENIMFANLAQTQSKHWFDVANTD